MIPPTIATTRGPRRSWIRPPMYVPTKIMKIAMENGSAASGFDKWKDVSAFCMALENTLHA